MKCTQCQQEMGPDETGIFLTIYQEGGHIICMRDFLDTVLPT